MQPVPASQKILLLVEDEPTLAQETADRLSRAGYQVLIAATAVEAIEFATRPPLPDLVLMDIHLGEGGIPPFDGASAAEVLLRERDVPVVFLSDHTKAEDLSRVEQVAGYGVICKMADEPVLLAAVRMALRQAKTNRRLIESQAENTLLLRELQHRIKNSMMLITSIINLEADLAHEPAAVQALLSIGTRIYTLSDLYSLLYQSDSPNLIPLHTYFQQIVQFLEATYHNHHTLFAIRAHYDPVEVDVKTATSLGLILNELVTNALKYAFPPGRDGTLWITLSRRAEAGLVLRVENDGDPLPEDFSLYSTTGLGLQLIRMLVSDLKGEFTFERGERIVFQVSL